MLNQVWTLELFEAQAYIFCIIAGRFRANPRFGAIPKVTASVVVGYFLGKFSYQSKCAEKLMQLPNSQIGEMLRRRRQGVLQERFLPLFFIIPLF